MSQAFRFGFGGEDIDEDPTDQDGENALRRLPSTISYNIIQVPTANGTYIHLGRREYFDIRTQWLAEQPMDPDAPVPFPGVTHDVVPEVYEGGLKTWEGSFDLACFIGTHIGVFSEYMLGCGTALPSLTLLYHLLSTPSVDNPPRRTFVFGDLNPAVIDLATLPNLILTYATQDGLIPLHPCDLDIEPSLISSFQNALKERNIDLQAVVGTWSSDYASLALRDNSAGRVLILAAETIYSLSSARAFTKTVVDIMRLGKERGETVEALVAAKKVYFGVGGGVDEFSKELNECGGESTLIWETGEKSRGVTRCIVETKLKGQSNQETESKQQ
ncbi:MAG: hypothetical protein LQ352_000621 [Teloschistes flavicans]|nr:MAG: hypothetical protein LQ352_000621 [Teloschistes flavicans]